MYEGATPRREWKSDIPCHGVIWLLLDMQTDLDETYMQVCISVYVRVCIYTCTDLCVHGVEREEDDPVALEAIIF